ncbi:MAG: polysaccharide biosynthesis tyrosine autokinase [Clostridia bacterium]|nr:polysaccharide biosynthesis tyrosine autokinase [Clostridia bacterium]
MEEHASNRWTDYSLVCIIRRIVKEIPTVIAAGLIAAMLTVAYLQVFYKPQYTASTTVAVGMKNASYTSVFSNLSSTSEMAGTFTKLFDSTMFSTISKEKLGVEKLNGELEAFVVPQTNLMTMRVTADNPTDAFKTLRFLLDNYSAVSDYVFQNVVLRELDPPSVPKSPSNPLQLRAAIERAFIIGAAAMAAALIASILLADRVQTTSAARHKIDAKLYCTIHHETKNKTLRTKLKKTTKGLLITNTTASFNFSEEVAKLASRVSHAVRRDKKNVILVTSVAENEGKSTVAANLAISLAQKGGTVLLIDADMHKPSQYKLLGAEVKTELADMIRGKCGLETEYIEKYGVNAMFSSTVQNDAAELISSGAMRSMMKELSAATDYTIIDSPPMAMFSDAEMLADIADLSLLVVRQDCVSAGRINDAVDMLNQSKAHLLGCVFNDVRVTPIIGSRAGYGYGYGYGSGYGYGYGRGYGGYGYGERNAKGGRSSRRHTEEANGRKEN